MPIFAPATTQGQVMSGDWFVFIVAGIAVGVIVYVLILLPLVLWRARTGASGMPPQFSRNRGLEITSWLVPLGLVGVLMYFTYVNELRVDAVGKTPFASVDVTGFRWSWRFDYAGTGVQVIGTPQQPPQLVLALGRTTQINLHTVDVNHSFWVPAFLFKLDAIPGMINRFDLTPTRAGTFRGMCTQFCGLNHALMTFTIRVIPVDAYRRWLASKERGNV